MKMARQKEKLNVVNQFFRPTNQQDDVKFGEAIT